MFWFGVKVVSWLAHQFMSMDVIVYIVNVFFNTINIQGGSNNDNWCRYRFQKKKGKYIDCVIHKSTFQWLKKNLPTCYPVPLFFILWTPYMTLVKAAGNIKDLRIYLCGPIVVMNSLSLMNLFKSCL